MPFCLKNTPNPPKCYIWRTKIILKTWLISKTFWKLFHDLFYSFLGWDVHWNKPREWLPFEWLSIFPKERCHSIFISCPHPETPWSPTIWISPPRDVLSDRDFAQQTSCCFFLPPISFTFVLHPTKTLLFPLFQRPGCRNDELQLLDKIQMYTLRPCIHSPC